MRILTDDDMVPYKGNPTIKSDVLAKLLANAPGEPVIICMTDGTQFLEFCIGGAFLGAASVKIAETSCAKMLVDKQAQDLIDRKEKR